MAQWALSTDVDLKPFIYVYELPPEYNEAFKALPAGWHSDQYDCALPPSLNTAACLRTADPLPGAPRAPPACLQSGGGPPPCTRAPGADGARRRRAVDITLHEYLLNSTRRQRDPDKASIFFMPVYLARLFNWFWTRQHCKSEADSPLSCMKEPDVRPARAPAPHRPHTRSRPACSPGSPTALPPAASCRHLLRARRTAPAGRSGA